MFINTLDPVLLQIGPLQIRYYGLVYAAGFLLAYFILLKKKDQLKATEDQISTLLVFIMLGMLVGARLFHFLIDDFSALLADPLELFRIWNGGMSFFGGFLGSVAAGAWYAQKQKFSWLSAGDVIVFPLVIALIFGRIANFFNGELVGPPSNVFWCVVYPGVDNICRHPYQLYASFSHVVLLGILTLSARWKKKNAWPDGSLLLVFIIGYAGLRFLTDFWREDPLIWGLTSWQWVSLGIIGLVTGVVRWYKKPSKQKSI
ncbi:prolipoprotein diacylglyceryl transferase [Candidatus Woesearchaeota archaeon]|nr:prolipoprotein diacylglyceryl transferase [Candidatus Woesearchaeota archaeon]